MTARCSSARTHRPVVAPDQQPIAGLDGRGAMMPKCKRTHNLQRHIDAECKLNDDCIAERNKPPPF